MLICQCRGPNTGPPLLVETPWQGKIINSPQTDSKIKVYAFPGSVHPGLMYNTCQEYFKTTETFRDIIFVLNIRMWVIVRSRQMLAKMSHSRQIYNTNTNKGDPHIPGIVGREIWTKLSQNKDETTHFYQQMLRKLSTTKFWGQGTWTYFKGTDVPHFSEVESTILYNQK